MSGLILINNTIGSFSLDYLEDVIGSGGRIILRAWGGRRSGELTFGITAGSGG